MHIFLQLNPLYILMFTFQQYLESNQAPTLKKTVVYHIGTFNPTKKLRNSFEGHCLSVSEHPRAWSRIYPMSGELYKLTNPNGTFLDYYEARRNKSLMQQIYRWAMQEGYITRGTIWIAKDYDEDGDPRYFSYSNREEAEREGGEIKEKTNSPVMTEKLARAIGWTEINPTMTKDGVILVYAESLGLDGVWWNDLLRPSSLSAPRGGIFPSKLQNWEKQKRSL